MIPKRAMALACMVATLSMAGCGQSPGSGQPDEQHKSPFATGNVSVAPQLEGRTAAPTPIPAPRPGAPEPEPEPTASDP
jgi:hypothetical protein